MVKMVAAEEKYHDANYKRKHAEQETQQEKNASNTLIQDEKKKSYDIMEDMQFMMNESHAKQQSYQRRVDLLIFFHKNERQLNNNNHEKVVSRLQTD